MSKKPELPAIPATVAGDMHSLLSAIRQRFVWLDEQLGDIGAQLKTTMRSTTGGVFDNGPRVAGQAFQPIPSNGAFQRVFNKGAHTLQPPTENCCINLIYVNVSGAGAITVSGFDKVTGTSAPPSNSTTAGQEFLARITVLQGVSLLEWLPLQ